MSSCNQSGGCPKCKFSLFEELESIEEIEMTIDRVNHVGKLSRPFLEHWTIFNFRCPLFWRFLTCELLQGRWTDFHWFITNYSRSKSCPILSFEDFGMDNFMEDKEMTTIGSNHVDKFSAISETLNGFQFCLIFIRFTAHQRLRTCSKSNPSDRVQGFLEPCLPRQ